MKIIYPLLVTLLVSALFSCSDDASTEDLSTIANDLTDKFGANAYYTELSITFNESIGAIVNATVTEQPDDLKMGQWTLSQGNWKQTAELTIEIPEETKASDFMFQLGNEISIEQLDKLVKQSQKALTKEKSIESPKLHTAFIKYPDNGDKQKAEYVVLLQPESGGTTFTYSYDLKGELINMDY